MIAATSPDQLAQKIAQQKLFGQGGPNPLFGAPDAQPPATTAAAAPAASPAPAAPSPAMSPAPSAAMLYGNSPAKPPMNEQDFSAQNPDASKAYMPVRPTNEMEFANSNHPTLMRALQSLFAGMSEFGRPGAGFGMVDRWNDQAAQQRQFDNPANQEKMKAGALNQAYQNYLQHGQEQAGIEHEQAETHNLQQNVPLLQHQQQFLDKVRGLKESGKYTSDGDLFNAVLPEASTIPGLTRQMIVDQINQAKPLGAQFSVQTDKQGRPEYVQDRAGGKHYPDAQGKFSDPEMQKQWDSEMQSHQQSIGEEENKEKRVAGYAADRQAAGFSQQEKMQGVHAVNERANTALDADQRLSRMEAAYKKAQNGDQQAMLSLLTDHIGMTLGMQKGARITKDILNEASQSQPWLQKLASKFDDRGYLSGVTLGPDQMRQMLDLGYDARDRAYGSAHDAATLYGVPLPKGMGTVERKRVTGDKPAINTQGGGQSGNTAKFTVGQSVTIKGKPMKITAVHADGSFDAK